jgi:hypothetical protein
MEGSDATYFKVLSLHLPTWAEERTGHFRQNSYIRMRLEAEISHGFAF